MFRSDTIDESFYAAIMEYIKQMNNEYFHLLRRDARKKTIRKIINSIWNGDFSAGVKLLSSEIRRNLLQWSNSSGGSDRSDYFSFDKVAVYTVITGNYDKLREPYCKPDNCDFFVFTDIDFDDSVSTWKKMKIPNSLDGLSNSMKNRYLKMHPHELFDQYKYSVYVDGNIQIYTDLTEYVNKIGPSGIAAYLHCERNCVYEEAREVLKRGKETKENIDRHLAYMKETGMPANYGLLECNVIAREHHNSSCIKIMEEWWQEYCKYSKRDQISLPHVLFRNGIKVQDIGVLGSDVWRDPSFRIIKHLAG